MAANDKATALAEAISGSHAQNTKETYSRSSETLLFL